MHTYSESADAFFLAVGDFCGPTALRFLLTDFLKALYKKRTRGPPNACVWEPPRRVRSKFDLRSIVAICLMEWEAIFDLPLPLEKRHYNSALSQIMHR